MKSITKLSIEQVVHKLLQKKGEFTTRDIVSSTGFSQPYIHRSITKLLENGEIIKLGNGRASYYARPGAGLTSKISRLSFKITNKNINESEILEDINRQSGILKNIPGNVKSIAEYAFTEMLNNAIEHSESPQIKIDIENNNKIIRFDITDYGIGIFNNLKRKFRLRDVYEAVQELLKGKQTTLPEAHSGEGIFFTSKAADTFIIQSSRKKLFVNNIIDDIFLRSSGTAKGTKITFTLSAESERELKSIFDEYTDDNFNFSRTKIVVKLFKYGAEFLSRSQARRVLTGLDKFKSISLDFRDVEEIGQAFADEVFRIYKRKNSSKDITYINANDDVEFMIRRALKSDL